MTALLLQSDGLTPTQHAVRAQFQEGGSFADVLLIVLCLVTLVVLVWWLTNRLRRGEAVPERLYDPERLFADWMDRLDFSVSQRQLLDTIVKELRVENPATMLLSSARFDRTVDQWHARHRQTSGDIERPSNAKLITQIRTALFATPS